MNKMALALAVLGATFFGTESFAKNPTIVIRGEGAVDAAPDVAYVTVAIRSRDMDPQKAQATTVALVKKLYTALEKQGVKSSDIGTTNYQFRREAREGEQGKIAELGYFAENSVQIKANRFEDMPSIIATAVANGATRVDDIQYTLNDPVSYVDRARVKAFQNAKDEAQKSADAAGLKLGTIVSISINGADIPLVTSMQRLNYGVADMPAPKLEPLLSPGVVHVTYSVNIEYEVLQ